MESNSLLDSASSFVLVQGFGSSLLQGFRHFLVEAFGLFLTLVCGPAKDFAASAQHRTPSAEWQLCFRTRHPTLATGNF